MKKNLILKTALITITLLVLSGVGYYIHLISKVRVLGDHYPVFNFENKSYELVKQKPAHWVSVKEVSNAAKQAIIISEDWAFYDHDGIDRNQIEIAIKDSWNQGKLTRGASTITQQVVKNTLLSSEKTLTRKLKEILLATELEKVLSKDQILEHYLNLIELGRDIYGIKQASFYYFNKSPANLSHKEGAFLAMLLPSPVKYSQSFRDKALTEFASAQVNEILVKLRQANFITEEQRVQQADIPLSFEKEKLKVYKSQQLLRLQEERFPHPNHQSEGEIEKPKKKRDKEGEEILEQIRSEGLNFEEEPEGEY